MTKLKPCPFCGNTAVDVKDDCYPAPNYYVVCDYNDDGCGASSGFCRTEEEAIEVWNRRASENDTKKE